MNAKKFSDAMSELDTKYVDEALNYKKKAKKPIWVKWGAIAACLCLMIPLTAFAVDMLILFYIMQRLIISILSALLLKI